MRLKRLLVKNFRGFLSAEIQFPRTGAVLISGDSGAGKTSILLAISYALDILPDGFSGSKQQNRSTKTGMQVVLELETPSGAVVIARGKENYIKTETETVSGAKACSDALPRILGIPSSLLGPMVYRPQKRPGLLMSMTPSQKAEFLIQVLDLQRIEDELEKSKSRQAELQKSVDRSSGVISVLSKILEVKTEAPRVLNEEMLRDEVSEAEAKVKEAELALVAAEQALENDRVLANQKVAEEKALVGEQFKKGSAFLSSMRTKLEEIRSSNEALRSEINKATQTVSHKDGYLREIAKYERDLGVLRSNKCALCGQEWHNNRAEQSRLESDISAVKRSVEWCDSEAKRIEVMAPELQSGTARLSDMMAKIADAQSKMNGISQKLAKLSSPEVDHSLVDAVSTSKRALSLCQEELRNRKEALTSASIGNKNAVARFEEQRRRAEESKAEFDRESESLASANKELRLEMDFCHTVGKDGFLSMFFADVLADISGRANGMLRSLPNVSGVSVSLAPESSKSGSRRLISADVFMDGQETDFNSGLSGGQQAVVEQVVDIALAQVLQDRTGKVPGFLMLDETLYGFGHATKEAVLEVLMRFAKDKLVLVIDHSSEVKEMFSSTIDIRRSGGVSYVA